MPRLLDLSYGPLSFWAGILVSALAVGLLGVAMEVLLLRRIYRAPELFQLLATFGVVLVVQDLVIRVFGPQDILGPRAPGLRAPVEILGRRFPSYELVLIAAGPVVLGLLWLLLNKTRFGVLVRAATQDREMVGALGVNQALLFTGTLFLGAFLAGLGGALQIPKAPAVAHMDLDIIAETFVVTVIGGMGSIPGAFLAALIIGQLNAFGILVFPKITLVLVFLLMGVVLVLRPYGLLGRPEAPAGAHVAAIGGRLRTWGAAEKAIALATLAGPDAAAAVRRCLCPEGRNRGHDLRPVRLLAAFPDRHRRPRELRPCRVFRAWRLWRRAGAAPSRRADGARAAARADRRRRSGRRCSASSSCGCRGSTSPC